ncbi:MAG: immunoglobulin-like domain-containing protein [Clostridium chrysemydis]|uniref:immunoglobulin-like domain-containing protein n=1 Tax=Clostridium chrysemydis TaxID=2665504 RepID=UPI003F3429A8
MLKKKLIHLLMTGVLLTTVIVEPIESFSLNNNNVSTAKINRNIGYVKTTEDNVIKDDNLREAINNYFNNDPNKPITKSELESMEILSIGAYNVKSLDGLQYCKNLKELDITLNQIEDISPIKNLINLKKLQITANNIKDINDLSNLSSLESLDISSDKISDISPIKRLLKIKDLDISNNQISDISDLINLDCMKSLNISYNNISDIDSIKNLIKIMKLDISNNQISDISVLSNLDSLEYLDASYNKISDINSIKGAKDLKELRFSDNLVSDISGVGGKKELKYLDFNDNKIRDIGPVSDLENLERIFGNDNDVSDLTPVKNLEKLEYLNFNDNKISEISSIGDLSNLKSVSLIGNQISDISTIKRLDNLPAYSIYNQDITLKKIDIKKFPIDIKNNVVGGDGKAVNIKDNDISSGGVFNKNTNEIRWNNVNGDLSYTFSIGDGTDKFFGGIVHQPYSVDVNNVPTINGAQNKTLKVSDKFIPLEGVTANDKEDGDITKNIKVIENTVDTSKAGTYKVVYEVTDSKGAKSTKTISVVVRSNDKPIIAGADNISLKEGESFDPMAGVTAKDTEDGDLTKDIKVSGEVNTKKPGSYEITYEVTDSDGNKTIVKRIVTINPKWSEINSIPTINGAKNKTLKISDKFNPLEGVTANDKEDGDITKNIKVIENTVDTSKAGTYKVVYEVTDSKGAKTTKTIIVIVRSNDKPIIAGADNISLKEGESFHPMAGVTAKDTEDGDLTKDIKVSGEVNTKKPGSYEITYEVTDSDGNKTTVKRIVTVNPKWSEINNIPTINGAKNKTLKISDKFNPLEGVTANDKEDGDITKKIKVIENTVDTSKAGTYKVIYEVTDSKGAKTTKTISVVVRSNDKPIIAGADNISLKEGESFDPMAGVTAKDTEDGDLTKDIKVSGEVNTKKPGSYEITYEVTDSDGNKTTVKRIVKVIPKVVQINNAPIIHAKDKVLKLGDKFNEMDGVTAFDREDGDITKNIKVIENTVDTSKAGKYKIVYEVSDSKGVKTIKEVSIVVKDNDYINNNNKLPKTGYSSLMVLLGTITTGLGIVFLAKKK